MSEFKYFGCILNESDTYDVKCQRKVASGRIFKGAIRSLINVNGLHLECVRVINEELLLSVLLYGSETLIWR